ncbi:RNA polymerase sigma factor [Acetobacter orientalis]|uniref:RNA polymerase sigma factor n=1 Tax=Acetobacter orientalis TaxID=146474 RepID=UPI0039EB3B65
MIKNFLMHQKEWSVLYRKVRSITKDNDAEDHVQAALVRYLEKNPTEVENKEAYVVKSAVNNASNSRKRSSILQIFSIHKDDTILEEEVCPNPLPDEVYAARQRLEKFQDGYNQLPERTRQILFWHRIEKVQYRDIAQRLGISESAVEKHIAKALVFLSTWVEN